MAQTLRAEPSALPIAIRFLSRRYRARPSSGCSGQTSPQASSRVRQPLIRSAVSFKRVVERLLNDSCNIKR
ncbi:MAG: hypothetical protein V1766_13545 [Pseudomonadota bacterium]